MATTGKTADDWFSEYGSCHQNDWNKLLHWICIPLIMLSLLGLIWRIPVPDAILRLIPGFNWCWTTILASTLFYLRLSIPLAIGMLAVTAAMVGLLIAYARLNIGPLWLASLVFMAAWIGQFVGHKLEGAKPAFIDDLKFLLIGPLWLLGFVYRKLGIRY